MGKIPSLAYRAALAVTAAAAVSAAVASAPASASCQGGISVRHEDTLTFVEGLNLYKFTADGMEWGLESCGEVRDLEIVTEHGTIYFEGTVFEEGYYEAGRFASGEMASEVTPDMFKTYKVYGAEGILNGEAADFMPYLTFEKIDSIVIVK